MARIDAAVPAAWLGPGGDLTLTLEAPSVQPPGERRPLGFLLDRVAVAGGAGPAWPPAPVALAALLLGGWVARLRGRALLVGALTTGAGLAVGIAGARPWIGLHAGTAAALLALAGAAVLLSPAAGARRPAAWLAVGLLAGYVLLLPGHFYVIDDDTKFAVTQSLVTRGSLFPVLPDGTPGPSKYGLGHSLATAPLLLLALGVEALRGGGPLGELRKLAVLLLDPLCTATTAGLLFLCARRLWPGAGPADRGRDGARAGRRAGLRRWRRSRCRTRCSPSRSR